jgi:catechol 2,3-dioxygenase-like lactoylglutathione lyase family enzyme
MSQNTFHVALSVKDLPTAVEYYKKILGIEPAKVKADYAKFEIADPPVILSLNPSGEPGTVMHLGIRYPETTTIETQLARAKAEGLPTREQPGTTCCYAKADKFWVSDADGLGWEMYTLIEDADIHSIGDVPPEARCSTACGSANATQIDEHFAQIQTKRACC